MDKYLYRLDNPTKQDRREPEDTSVSVPTDWKSWKQLNSPRTTTTAPTTTSSPSPLSSVAVPVPWRISVEGDYRLLDKIEGGITEADDEANNTEFNRMEFVEPEETSTPVENIANVASPSLLTNDFDDTVFFDPELNTPFEDAEKNPVVFGERREKLNAIEEQQLEKFHKLTRFTEQSVIFPPVRFTGGTQHTFGFFLQESFKPKTDSGLRPYPRTFTSKWNPDFVPMPCSPENQRLEMRPTNVNTAEKFQNWKHIRKVLSETIESCDDLNQRINQITFSSQNLNVLRYTIDQVMSSDDGFKFFETVLPFIVKLCLDLPEILTCPLPLLKRFRNHSISLTQLQIASVLANAFFCTFPEKLKNNEDFPSINFTDLYICDPEDSRLSSMAHKLRCYLHYFERLSDKTEDHNGIVTFTRKCNILSKCPNWDQSTKQSTQMVSLCNGTIEDDGAGMLQVDFANKYIGGGVLGRGAVQEEILFAIYPELLISRLFTEKLFSGEALLVTGCERFCTYHGYSSSFEFSGNFEDTTEFDSKGRRLSQIVCIDALYIHKPLTQFSPKCMERELNKAYAGFSIPTPNSTRTAIASGKWGCGAFNGDPELKAILQLLAASEAGRDLVIFVFGDGDVQESLVAMYEVLKNLTVGEIWKQLKQYYSLFCADNEANDIPVTFTIKQFVLDYVSTYNLDMTDASQNTRDVQPNQSTNQPLRDGSTSQEEHDDGDEITIFPVSPATIDKEHVVIDIDDDCTPVPATPTKRVSTEDSQPLGLAVLFSESEQVVGTPSKIGVLDLDKGTDYDRSTDCTPLVSDVPDPNYSIPKRVQRILQFANSSTSSDDEGETESQRRGQVTPKKATAVSPKKAPVDKVITDDDYRAVFSSPPRAYRISKQVRVKRKLSTSPDGIKSQSPGSTSILRRKLEVGPSSTASATGLGQVITLD